jgi:hypothetical protein
MGKATRRMSSVLDKLPREITPQNLEELRRVKQALVELESKADQLRCEVFWFFWNSLQNLYCLD